MKRLLPLLLPLVACAANRPAASPYETVKPTVAVATVVNEIPLSQLATEEEAFAMDLLRPMVDEKPDANLVYSPHSIAVALGMAHAGARGEAAASIAKVMHIDSGDRHAAIEAMGRTLTASAAKGTSRDGAPMKLRFVNSLWGDTTTAFEPGYVSFIHGTYGADLNRVNFDADPEGARGAINLWVSERTEKKIPELIPKKGVNGARAVMVNAAYFDGAWKTPFPPARPGTFHAIDGDREVPLMGRQASMRYAETGLHQVVEIPYAGDELSMVVVLPAPGKLADVEKELGAGGFTGLLRAAQGTDLALTLPRFKADTSRSLKATLVALGMGPAFSPGADLRGITAENLVIGNVFHSGFVSVEEKGTEAAAATAVVVTQPASVSPPPRVMTVDRPFLFAIRERSTGLVLFVGRIVRV